MDGIKIIDYLAVGLAVIFVMSMHEFAHAFTAVKFGDETPRVNGRLTLNPLAHIDPIGFIMLIFCGFGWAKPVPVNPYNFKKLRSGYFWTSFAGILTNYILAFLFYPLMILSIRFNFDYMFFDELLIFFLTYVVELNLCFFVFNLLPVYPLDGFRIMEVFLKPTNKICKFLHDFGRYILLSLLILSFIAERVPSLYYLDILGYFLNFAKNVIGYPIMKFWFWIFSFGG